MTTEPRVGEMVVGLFRGEAGDACGHCGWDLAGETVLTVEVDAGVWWLCAECARELRDALVEAV